MKLSKEELVTLSRLLDEAWELPAEGREAWLESLVEPLRALRPSLRELLARQARAETDDFLDTLPKFTIAGDEDHIGTRNRFEPGVNVGPYQLVRELGQGGMGEVWLATRSDGLLNRNCALKLPHAHLLSGALSQRFERERDILAALSHPHIASLYDAGISEGGVPYLAMEWIDGVPITQYCRAARLSLEARLAQFQQVLDAVHYAHIRFVAHRDLKPSNILVTQDGQVKLLDFGIAKILTSDTAGVETALTHLGGRAVTPDYAAPEQLAGQPITTAVDVYALGVVLFELLTGTRPFERSRGEALEAPLASQRVADPEAQQINGLNAAQLRSVLRGDLDAIIAKALAVDPTQRYRLAADLADDLQRYQHHVPIAARRISKFSTLVKLTRRYRLATALTVSLVVVLLGGTLGIGWQAAKARRAAELAGQQAVRAESEANRERVTKDFLINVFKASDPRIASDKPRGTITAKELLDISSDRIEQQFKNDPDAELELLGVAADIYGEFGETARSEKLLQRRVDLAQARDGELSPILIGGLLQQTSNSNDRNEYAAALKQLDRIDALIKRAGMDRSAERARWWLLRSGALYADPNAEKEKAEALRKAVELFAEVAPNDRNYPQALADLGNVYFALPDFPRAVDYNRRAIAVLESQTSGDEGDLVQLYGNLAISLTYVGDFDGAERAYAHATELARRTYGDKHRFYWVVAARYAQTVHLRGERERASQMFEQLLPLIPARSGEFRNAYDEHEAAIVNETYGACLAADGRVGAAIPFLEAAEYEYTKAQQYSYEIAHLRSILGLAYDRAGRTIDARRMLQAALDKYSSLFKPNHAGLLRQRQLWGSFLVRHDSLTEAEQQFREVLKLAADGNAFFVALAHGGLAQIAIKRRNVPAAEDSSRRAVELFDHVSGFRDVRMGPYLWRIRAESLFLSGDLQGARWWAERALDADRRYDDPSSGEIAEADETFRAVIAARNK